MMELESQQGWALWVLQALLKMLVFILRPLDEVCALKESFCFLEIPGQIHFSEKLSLAVVLGTY